MSRDIPKATASTDDNTPITAAPPEQPAHADGEQAAGEASSFPATSTPRFEAIADGLRETIRKALATIQAQTNGQWLTLQQHTTIEESLTFATWLQHRIGSRTAHPQVYFLFLPISLGTLVCMAAFLGSGPYDTPWGFIFVVGAAMVSLLVIGSIRLNIALNANARDLAAHHQALLCLDFLELLNVATIPGPLNSNALNTRGNNIVTRIEDARPRLAAVSARDARHLGRHTTALIAAALSDRPGAREKLSTFALQSMVELAAGSLGKQAWFAAQDLLPEEPEQPARITPLRTFLRELWRYLWISVFLLAAFVAFELKLKPMMEASPWDMLAMGVRTVFVLLGLTIAGSLIKRVFPEAPDPTKTVLDLFKNK